MSRKHFTINERNQLDLSLKENYKITRIAKILKKDRATIFIGKLKELKVNIVLKKLR